MERETDEGLAMNRKERRGCDEGEDNALDARMVCEGIVERDRGR